MKPRPPRPGRAESASPTSHHLACTPHAPGRAATAAPHRLSASLLGAPQHERIEQQHHKRAGSPPRAAARAPPLLRVLGHPHGSYTARGASRSAQSRCHTALHGEKVHGSGDKISRRRQRWRACRRAAAARLPPRARALPTCCAEPQRRPAAPRGRRARVHIHTSWAVTRERPGSTSKTPSPRDSYMPPSRANHTGSSPCLPRSAPTRVGAAVQPSRGAARRRVAITPRATV